LRGAGTGLHNVSLYLVDWDRQGRRIAVDLREYANLQLAAPTQYVSNFTEGKTTKRLLGPLSIDYRVIHQ